MNEYDIRLLKTAAIELESNKHDLVRVASVVQRIKNWWRAIWDPTYRQKQSEVEGKYNEIKGPLKNLIDGLKNLDKAFSGNDPETVARLVGEIPSMINDVTGNLEGLGETMREADAAIPRVPVTADVSEDGTPSYISDIKSVREGYSKDQAVLQQLFRQLPPEIQKEIPISGSINRPVKSFEWFQKYSPNDIDTSDNSTKGAKTNFMNRIIQAFERDLHLSRSDANKLIISGFEKFLDNCKVYALEHGELVQYWWPKISLDIPNQPVNQMMATINIPAVPFPAKKELEMDILFDVSHFELKDLGAGRTRRKKLSLYNAGSVSVNMDSKNKFQKKYPKIYDFEIQSSNKLLGIVKRAVLSNTLPITRILISINDAPTHYRLKLAKLLTSALRGELDADSPSIHHEGDVVEIEADFAGSEGAVDSAVNGVTSAISEAFTETTGIEVGFETSVNKGSKLELVSMDDLESSLRKVAMDQLAARIKNG